MEAPNVNNISSDPNHLEEEIVGNDADLQTEMDMASIYETRMNLERNLDEMVKSMTKEDFIELGKLPDLMSDPRVAKVVAPILMLLHDEKMNAIERKENEKMSRSLGTDSISEKKQTVARNRNVILAWLIQRNSMISLIETNIKNKSTNIFAKINLSKSLEDRSIQYKALHQIMSSFKPADECSDETRMKFESMIWYVTNQNKYLDQHFSSLVNDTLRTKIREEISTFDPNSELGVLDDLIPANRFLARCFIDVIKNKLLKFKYTVEIGVDDQSATYKKTIADEVMYKIETSDVSKEESERNTRLKTLLFDAVTKNGGNPLVCVSRVTKNLHSLQSGSSKPMISSSSSTLKRDSKFIKMIVDKGKISRTSLLTENGMSIEDATALLNYYVPDINSFQIGSKKSADMFDIVHRKSSLFWWEYMRPIKEDPNHPYNAHVNYLFDGNICPVDYMSSYTALELIRKQRESMKKATIDQLVQDCNSYKLNLDDVVSFGRLLYIHSASITFEKNNPNANADDAYAFYEDLLSSQEMFDAESLNGYNDEVKRSEINKILDAIRSTIDASLEKMKVNGSSVIFGHNQDASKQQKVAVFPDEYLTDPKRIGSAMRSIYDVVGQDEDASVFDLITSCYNAQSELKAHAIESKNAKTEQPINDMNIEEVLNDFEDDFNLSVLKTKYNDFLNEILSHKVARENEENEAKIKATVQQLLKTEMADQVMPEEIEYVVRSSFMQVGTGTNIPVISSSHTVSSMSGAVTQAQVVCKMAQQQEYGNLNPKTRISWQMIYKSVVEVINELIKNNEEFKHNLIVERNFEMCLALMFELEVVKKISATIMMHFTDVQSNAKREKLKLRTKMEVIAPTRSKKTNTTL